MKEHEKSHEMREKADDLEEKRLCLSPTKKERRKNDGQ